MNRLSPVALLLPCVLSAPLAAQKPSDMTPFLIADRAAEIALARSAAPKAVSDSATILVMTRTGLTEAVRGSNGFTCFVLRAFSAGLSDPAFWNPRIRAPHCLNAPAVRTVLPEIKARVEWVLAGVSLDEIRTRTDRGYASKQFPAPAPGAMAYMLSPRQYLTDGDDTRWEPHLMFYYPGTMPASTWGAGDFTALVINASDGDKPPVVTLLVPVQQWADGAAAVP